MKKILSACLIVVILMTLLPSTMFTAAAIEWITIGDDELGYEAELGGYVVVNYDSASGEVIIPSRLDPNNSYTNVYRIGTSAFYGNTALTSVVIEEGVEYIDDSAFEGCTNLESITIPSSVYYFGEDIFAGCENLKTIYLADGAVGFDYSLFEDTAYYKNEDNWEDGVLYVGNHLLDTSEQLPESYDIRLGTVSIAEKAFWGQDDLKKVTIPDSVSYIGEEAFGYCSNLKVIAVPRNPWVEDDAFEGCYDIESVWYVGDFSAYKDGKYDRTFPYYYCDDLLYATWYTDVCTRGGKHSYSGNSDFSCNKCEYTRNIFSDVKSNQYYFDPVLWAIKEGITSGTSASAFSPNMACDRAQTVTFLWRAAGCPEPQSLDNPFKDVKESDYFYKAVLWAVENEITAGTGNGRFSPKVACDRAQILTLIYRALGCPASYRTDDPYYYTDVDSNAYYSDAFEWGAGWFTSGTGNGKFSPHMTCTRAQIVTFLYRAYK